ncbi:hypothetical protein [Gracilimonas sp.]|uniref:hypothetical protein n=1 Tax=Gracilimonas sp. TaxID=1974203 RepID=UPI002871BBAE|nr:hypothetical protein [Gracilimonas sp.]
MRLPNLNINFELKVDKMEIKKILTSFLMTVTLFTGVMAFVVTDCAAFRIDVEYYNPDTQQIDTREECGVYCDDGFSRNMPCDSDFIQDVK